jgi:glycerophosphoryl diester phosphodiesterase
MHSPIGCDSGLSFNTRVSPAWSLSKQRSYCPSEKMPLLREQTNDFPMREKTHLMNCQQPLTQIPALWTHSTTDKCGRRFPQAIAHRGYKALHPENTMRSFEAAVNARAHAIETDIHLSKDGVVVLSHDADLKRCFGVKKKIIDCDWAELSQLRTLQEPHEPMPRLLDLLDYISQPGLEHIWLLLDIKLDNIADDVMRLIAQTVDSVPPSQSRTWRDRILLGIWAAKFLPLCSHYLPRYPITHIGFSTCYARKFLSVPNVGFNMLQKVLLGPIGTRFIRDVKEAKRHLFVWTVNEKNLMKWSIQKEVDGVITDDIKKFREICDDWSDDDEPVQVNFAQWLYTFWLYFVVLVFGLLFRYRFPETVEDFMKTNRLQGRDAGKVPR